MAQTRRIPFEITADPDPFYDKNNIRYLEKKMEDYKAGRLKLTEHELIKEYRIWGGYHDTCFINTKEFCPLRSDNFVKSDYR